MKREFKKSNPVTVRLSEMREKWMDSVCCQTEVVKWLLETDELRMYQAFSIIESSNEGMIPQYFMRFSVPFHHAESYGRDLIRSWLSTWGDLDEQAKISLEKLPKWDDSFKEEWLLSTEPKGFLECMASFARSIPGRKSRLVLDIVPEVCYQHSGWVGWLGELAAGIPEELCVMIYDSVDHPHLPEFPEGVNTVSIVANLEMQKAMKEVVASSDQSKPGPQFNLCLLNLGDCLQSDDMDGVHHWGQKALSVGQKANSASLQMAAFLAYGSALYQKNNFSDAAPLFLKAKELGLLHPNDPSVKALMVQTYSFLGGTSVSQKEYGKGFHHYGEMAIEAHKQQNGLMEIEARRLQASLPGRSISDEERFEALRMGFSSGQKLDVEIQPYSSLLPVCQQLVGMARKLGHNALATEVKSYGEATWGHKWEELGVAESLVSIQSSSQKREGYVIGS